MLLFAKKLIKAPIPYPCQPKRVTNAGGIFALHKKAPAPGTRPQQKRAGALHIRLQGSPATPQRPSSLSGA